MYGQGYLNYRPDDYLAVVTKIRQKCRRTKGTKELIMIAQGAPDDLSWYEESAIALPADSTTTPMIQYQVPAGRNLIITDIRNTWSGTGFQNGAGDLTWSFVIGGGFINNMGNVTFKSGDSVAQTRIVGQGGSLVYENQTVQVNVITGANANANLGGGRVEVQMRGWLVQI
jgi:hypothetical protein